MTGANWHVFYSINSMIFISYVSHSKTKQMDKVYFRRFSSLLKSNRTQRKHSDHPADQCPWTTCFDHPVEQCPWTIRFLAIFLIDHTPLHWYELIWIKEMMNIKYISIFQNVAYLVRHVVWCSYIIIRKSSCQASTMRHHMTIICNQ